MESLIRDVKYNCDLSDALHWGYFSICGLLMRMRDLYRTELGLRPWEPINREEIVDWIGVREEYWSELQDQHYRNITTPATSHDTFDSVLINREIGRYGLVYGAGYALYMKPTFFIGEIQSCSKIDGHTAYVVKKESARDLFASAGMLQGRDIFVRLDPLRVLLWERFMEAQGRGDRHSLQAFAAFGITPGQDLDAKFDSQFSAFTEHYAQVVLLHELAEAREDLPEWPPLLSQCEDRRTEYLLRQVKDAIADTSDRGPLKYLIDRRDSATLALYLQSFTAYQKRLCLRIRESFDEFVRTGDWDAFDFERQTAFRRLTSARDEILESHRSCTSREDFLADMERLEKRLSGDS